MDSPTALATPPKIDPNGGPTRIFEPADSLLIRAIARHKALVALAAVALAVVGLGVGMLRPTTYTASATLQVGQVNPNSPGFLGYVQSASSLATAFSRSIAATPVLAKVDRTLGVSATEATSRLSAEPIPLSPAFRVIGTGSSAESAMRLANVAATAVAAYESRANSSNPEARSLLGDYRDASVAVRQAEAEVADLAGQGSAAALISAEARRNAAKVKLRAIETAYVSAVAGQAPREGLVSLLAGATSASSDRKSKLELFAFLGLLAGIAAGCAAAVVRERRRFRIDA
ncbi:MAG TPA: Wzz/FepE/Etk N-terminal domain-containing protein [Solirubrobacterales bacterium]|nr:Wzz/FepE/Etk N-terminal domain-containing protein [Solirubrobacterales bacterium]